jgi:hypothetical protein
MNETPNLIALHPLALHAAHMLVILGKRDLASIAKQLIDGIDRTPTIRSIERIEGPSQRRVRIWARLAMGSLFMPLRFLLAYIALQALCL